MGIPQRAERTGSGWAAAAARWRAPECLTVVHTGHGRRDGADDRIVELVHEQPDRSASLVYTSDAKLRTRVKALGTQVMGSGTLLSRIATLRATMEPTDNKTLARFRRRLRTRQQRKRRPADHLHHRSQETRAFEMNGAGTRCQEIRDSSLVPPPAQPRAKLESPRAWGPYRARCGFSFATMLRAEALHSKWARFLLASRAGELTVQCHTQR